MTAIIIGSAVALVFGLAGTRAWIGLLSARNYGQFIRDDGPTTHQVKHGTPTMGGVVIVSGAVVGYALAHLLTWTAPTASGVLVLFLTAGLGAVGFVDDLIKATRRRSLGFRSAPKFACQVAVAVLFVVGVLYWPPDAVGLRVATPAVTFIGNTPLVLPVVVFVVWVGLVIAGTSNAVNLTDGLDGLAAGSSVMVFAAYVVIGVWEFGKACTQQGAVADACYATRDPYDLALVAAVMVGSCFGLLWWNAAPARIFMGDTGSLAIGGALAGWRSAPGPRCCCRSSAAVRRHHRLGDHPGRLVPAVRREAGVPDGAAAAPLRAGRAGRRSRSWSGSGSSPGSASRSGWASSTPSGWPGRDRRAT